MTKRLCATILVSVFMLMLAAAPLPAETGIVKYQGSAAMLPYSLEEDVYRDGTFFHMWYTGMIPMWLNGTTAAVPPYSDGTPIEAYCVDIYNNLDWNHAYGVTIVPLPAAPPWQEIAYMLNQNLLAAAPDKKVLGAALQTAIWKLVYVYDANPFLLTVLRAGANPASPTPADLTEEDLALELIAQAMGNRLLSCEENGPVIFTVQTLRAPANSNTLTITVSASQAGLPAVGQPVILTASSGSFISPSSGEGVTDENGLFVATLDLSTAVSPVQILAQAVGETVYLLDDGSSRQNLIYSKPCLYEASTSFQFSKTCCHNPCSFDFWKRFCAPPTGNCGGRERQQSCGGFHGVTLHQMCAQWLRNICAAHRVQQGTRHH